MRLRRRRQRSLNRPVKPLLGAGFVFDFYGFWLGHRHIHRFRFFLWIELLTVNANGITESSCALGGRIGESASETGSPFVSKDGRPFGLECWRALTGAGVGPPPGPYFGYALRVMTIA